MHEEFPHALQRGGITNKFFFYKMQITNLTPSKNRLMHHLVPCIATSVQYFQNVVPIFCDGYLILEKNINFCEYLFYNLWCHNLYCSAPPRCRTMHILSPKYLNIKNNIFLTVPNNLILKVMLIILYSRCFLSWISTYLGFDLE